MRAAHSAVNHSWCLDRIKGSQSSWQLTQCCSNFVFTFSNKTIKFNNCTICVYTIFNSLLKDTEQTSFQQNAYLIKFIPFEKFLFVSSFFPFWFILKWILNVIEFWRSHKLCYHIYAVFLTTLSLYNACQKFYHDVSQFKAITVGRLQTQCRNFTSTMPSVRYNATYVSQNQRC